jgi:hypothetical protein
MKSDISDPKEHYKQINLFFIALFLGILILFGASVFIRITNNLKFTFGTYEETGIIFKILLGIFIIILFPLSYILHRGKTEKLKKNPDLAQKLAAYKTSLMVKLIIIEYLCIFNLVTFFLFGGPYLLIPVSVFLLILLINRPTIDRISTELNLTAEEREKILQS